MLAKIVLVINCVPNGIYFAAFRFCELKIENGPRLPSFHCFIYEPLLNNICHRDIRDLSNKSQENGLTQKVVAHGR